MHTQNFSSSSDSHYFHLTVGKICHLPCSAEFQNCIWEEKQQPSFSSHCKPQPQCLKAILVNPLSESGAAQTSPFQESQPFSQFLRDLFLSFWSRTFLVCRGLLNPLNRAKQHAQNTGQAPGTAQRSCLHCRTRSRMAVEPRWNDSSCSAAAERAIRKAASPAGQPACIYISGALCHDSQTQEIHISSPSSLPWEHQSQAHRCLLRFIPKHY